MKKDNRFNIDFTELAILTEACITPSPIARALFFESVSDKYYHVLTKGERVHLFNWICKSYSFQHGIKEGDNGCLLFQARFDPDNQYEIELEYDNNASTVQAFLFKGRYHIKKDTSVIEDFAKRIVRTHDGKIVEL